MPAESRPREVSCLVLRLFAEYVASHGIDDSVVYEDLPYPADFLRDRLNWMDWETFLKVERRVAELFPDESDLFFRIGRAATKTHSLKFVRTIVSAVVTPRQTYRQLARIVPRFLFPFVRIDIDRERPGIIQATYTFSEGFAPTQSFVETVRGILTGMPTMVGAAPARVSIASRAELVVLYRIEVFAWLGPVDTLRQILRRIATLAHLRMGRFGATARELEEANELLKEKVDALTIAKSDLDQRVAELTLLSRLAASSTAQLNLQLLVRSAVEVISQHWRDRPVVLLLAEGGPDSWVTGAVAGLEQANRRELERELRLGGGWEAAVEASTADEGDLELAGLHWSALDLRVGVRRVGMLLLSRRRDEDLGDSLRQSMAHQLAVAIDNAQSYRLIADLRDNLERRVEERTAQLEEARGMLEHTITQLRAANRAKQAFFTDVSHELKTPLTLILAPLDDLEASLVRAGDRVGTSNVASLRRNARNLHALVEELLDFSRLDGGRLRVDKQPVALGLLIADVVDTLRPLADRRRIALAIHPEPGEVTAQVDPALLRRVLFNLIGNAVKYIDDGDRIDVSVEARIGVAVIAVQDSGPGIPPEQADLVFERFHRGWNASGRVVEGSGIGLAMAREIVELHGGTLVLDTQVARGSRFVVRLPLGEASAAAAPPPLRLADDQRVLPASTAMLLQADSQEEDEAVGDPPTAADEEGRKLVLVVEDNDDMRAFFTCTLGGRYKVRTARDGMAGLERARALLPDLVLSDVAMPRLDGLELCRRLKADRYTRNIPVVLVSARPGSSAALDGFAAGANDCVVKPFSAPELLARVDAQLRISALTLALIRTEKQASLGMMAAGIAHEVLNPVNVIVNGTSLLRRSVRAAAPAAQHDAAQEMIDLVERAGQRIRQVVEGVLTLARQDDRQLRLEEVRYGPRLASILQLLHHRAERAGVAITVDNVWDGPVVCHPNLLDQAVTNLIANAIDAMAARKGGKVTITCDRSAGAFVLQVADDGPGIPPDLRDRIFSPFFTTKPPGSGTGLGLSLCREIAGLHGGSIELVPTETGATFAITVPLGNGAAADEATDVDGDGVGAPPHPGGDGELVA